MAREEIAEALIESLGSIRTDDPSSVSSVIADCPLMCPFSKACFAQVCVDQGLMILCS